MEVGKDRRSQHYNCTSISVPKYKAFDQFLISLLNYQITLYSANSQVDVLAYKYCSNLKRKSSKWRFVRCPPPLHFFLNVGFQNIESVNLNLKN